MKIPKIFYTGLNLFKQYENRCEFYIDNIKSLNIYDILESFDVNCKVIDNFEIVNSWSTTLISINEYIIVVENCFEDGSKKTIKKLKENVKKMSCCDEYGLILLENGSLWKCLFTNFEIIEIQFLDVEKQLTDKLINIMTDYITGIACSETFSVATTNKGDIYNIPTKLFTLKNNDKIKKICCGKEHAAMLTVNGDVYTWGAGTRGQLGMGDLNGLSTPSLVEALSGIKIIDIDAGGWHTCCVSAFGDLYSWGWNIDGQLGLRIYETNKNISKNPALYALPQIIDITHKERNCINVTSVACGSRHTVITTDEKEYFSTGWNQYGQCGHVIDSEYNKIDVFSKINSDIVSNHMYSNNWTTIFYSDNN